MAAPFSHTQTLSDEAATSAFAQKLAKNLGRGDTILLKGPVGAGKTHIARSIIQQKLADAGLWEDVPSPTYTIVQTYQIGDLEIWHADFYRLSSPDELSELGLFEALPDALCLIEWPELFEPPARALEIKLSLVQDGAAREITLSGSESWASRLRYLSAAEQVGE